MELQPMNRRIQIPFIWNENGTTLYDDGYFREWMGSLTPYLEHSHLLLSTQGGSFGRSLCQKRNGTAMRRCGSERSEKQPAWLLQSYCLQQSADAVLYLLHKK